MRKAAELDPFFWRPEGDETHQFFLFDPNGAELSRIIISERVYVHIIPTTTVDIS